MMLVNQTHVDQRHRRVCERRMWPTVIRMYAEANDPLPSDGSLLRRLLCTQHDHNYDICECTATVDAWMPIRGGTSEWKIDIVHLFLDQRHPIALGRWLDRFDDCAMETYIGPILLEAIADVARQCYAGVDAILLLGYVMRRTQKHSDTMMDLLHRLQTRPVVETNHFNIKKYHHDDDDSSSSSE